MEIQLIFTQNNKLKIKIISDQYLHGDFKICFSLVYSIEDISGATILNKVGRYYELHSQQDEIFLTLQEPRIGSYNLSCGPEGLFILDKKNQNFQLAVRNLPYANVLLVDGLNVFDLLKHEKIVCTKDALQKIEERLN